MNKKIKLTANILFSGIGAQERGFEDSGLFDIEVLNTSDINKESVLSYAAIHCGMTNQMVDAYTDYPSREEMAQYLTDINLGYVPEKDKYFDWFKLVKRKKNDLEKYWLACKLTNNLGDISRIDELPYADFWTCSFPCTDISVTGKMKGLNPDTNTRSSLLWDNIKLLNIAKDNNTLPKYIMFENVKNLVNEKFIDDFNNLIDILGELGFNTYWEVINGKDCGIPQNRERVFVICIRKDIDTEMFAFPKPFDIGIRLKDIIEKGVDSKNYLTKEKADNITKLNDKINGEKIRKLTAKECWMLMDFSVSDYEKAESLKISKIHLYKQAGNSIIISCCKLLAEHLYKAQYNPMYICFDETHKNISENIETNKIIKIFDIPKDILSDNERQRRVYSIDGISPTILARADSAKILEK